MANPPRQQRRAADLEALLDALACGGWGPAADLEEWEDHINGRPRLQRSPVVRWFLAALRHEWHPLDPPGVLCMEIADHVRDYLRSRSGPWTVLWGHTMRVAGYALWLAEQRSVDQEAAFLAALLHDIGKLDERLTGQPHEPLGAAYAARLLAGELPRETVHQIQAAIAIHPELPPLSWPVARILHDADKLDKIGAAGLLRRASAAEDVEEACAGAERTLEDADAFPVPSIAATADLLRPKLAFAHTLEALLEDCCLDW